jgi:membrane-bound lytic murein transglycosylase D
VGDAKQEFDEAITLLMESSYGGRTEPRIREHFDRLVDRISAFEIRALAEGDGFTEKQYEPASIDDLLAMSASVLPVAPEDGIAGAVQNDPVEHDIPIPLNQRVLAFIELFKGRLHDFLEEGMKRGTNYLPMIQGVFRAEGLPLDLAYIPLVESAFKRDYVNVAGLGRRDRAQGPAHGVTSSTFDSNVAESGAYVAVISRVSPGVSAK